MTQHLFVYGTLTIELAPSEISGAVKKLKYVDDGFIHGRLYNLGEYPAAILSNSDQKVFGKIYELPDDPAVLQQLDQYEEFFPHNKSKSLFVRKQVYVNRSNKRRVLSWIYLYNKDLKSSTAIPSGTFAKIAA